jgi:hypothetical protein
MSVKWDIAERINKCGYDMMTSLEMAHELIEEFNQSGEKTMRRGVMNGYGKCLDVIVLQRNTE